MLHILHFYIFVVPLFGYHFDNVYQYEKIGPKGKIMLWLLKYEPSVKMKT